MKPIFDRPKSKVRRNALTFAAALLVITAGDFAYFRTSEIDQQVAVRPVTTPQGLTNPKINGAPQMPPASDQPQRHTGEPAPPDPIPKADQFDA